MRKVIAFFILSAGLEVGATVLFWNLPIKGAEAVSRIDAQLLPPPQVPPPITRRNPATVVVRLESYEKRGHLADGVEYEFWTLEILSPARSFAYARETQWKYT